MRWTSKSLHKNTREAYNKSMKGTVKYGSGSIMAQSCMVISGVRTLVIIDSTMNVISYLDILKDNLHQSTCKFELQGLYTSQQDCDFKHTALKYLEMVVFIMHENASKLICNDLILLPFSTREITKKRRNQLQMLQNRRMI